MFITGPYFNVGIKRQAQNVSDTREGDNVRYVYLKIFIIFS